MKKLISAVAILVIVTAIGLLFATASVYAQEGPLLDRACNQAPNSDICKAAAGQTQAGNTSNPVVNIINTTANIIALVAGIVAVITIIYSGFVFVTAGGTGFKSDNSQTPSRAAKARSTMVNALIGLVVIALAWSITRFITNQVIQ